MSFDKKIVAVEPGVIMNALAHLSIGLGTELGRNELCLDTYIDKDENLYPNISQMPFIILAANSNKIASLYQWAKASTIKHSVFLDTMTGDTYVEQLTRTKNTHEKDLTFYGIVLFGPWDLLTEVTRKFSLWR